MRALILLVLLALPGAAWSGEAPAPAADPALEARVTALASELRCLVCQNQTLADSNAPLAVDLRAQIREQMRQGRSEKDVIDYLVARYGDFVLYRPPFKATTLLLWTGPAILLLVGLAVLYRRLRQRPAEGPGGLSEADEARARALLQEPGPPGAP